MNGQGASAFGALLRRHRLASGLTQEELADRARLSTRAIADLERGARLVPRRDTVHLLAEALALAAPERSTFEGAARRKPSTAEPPSGTSPEQTAASTYETSHLTVSGGFPGPLPPGPLVARQVELQRLMNVVEDAANAHGRLVLLDGEPGVGKTRLAQEALLLAEDRGFTVLAGRCYEQHAALPFFPFTEALSASLTTVEQRRQALVHFPQLNRLLPEPFAAPARQDAAETQILVLRAVQGFFHTLAAQAPVALLLEDLHWADSASLDLVLYLARRCWGDRFILIGTYRDVEMSAQPTFERVLAELLRERSTEEIALRGFAPEGTTALVAALLGHTPDVDGLAAVIHTRTDGNPFLIEEVLKALQAQSATGSLTQARGPGEQYDLKVPRSVRSLITQRVRRLSSSTQETLRLASVLGQEWDLAVLMEAAGQGEAAVLDALDTALGAGLLEERQSDRQERYAFSHALIGQALYDDLPRHRQRRLHLRAGEALERVRGTRADAWVELVRHFLSGGHDPRAIRYALLAGDHAAALYANTEAAQQYRIAAALLDEAGETIAAAEAREKLGAILFTLAQFDQAVVELERAASTYFAAQDVERWAQAHVRLGQVHADRGSQESGIVLVQAAIDALYAALPESPILAALYATLADVYTTGSVYGEFPGERFAAGLAAASRAEVLARAHGDRAVLAQAVYRRGAALSGVGRADEALPVLVDAIGLAEAADDLYSLGWALAHLSNLYANCGDFGQASQCIERMCSVAERRGNAPQQSIALLVRGALSFYTGDWSRARADWDTALSLCDRAPDSVFSHSLFLIPLSYLAQVTGQWSTAATLLQLADAAALRNGRPQHAARVSTLQARLELLQGQPRTAQARLAPRVATDHAQAWYEPNDRTLLAWAYLDLGDLAACAATAREALHRARAGKQVIVQIETLQVQAALEIRQAFWREAEGSLQEALELAQPLPYPYAEAHSFRLYGELHAARGEHDLARARLAESLALFERLGARTDVEQTKVLLRPYR